MHLRTWFSRIQVYIHPASERGVITGGEHFPDKYFCIREIGRGRSGRVFLARHKTLGELRAVKQVPLSGNGLREAEILGGLSYPGIPRVYDVEQDSSYVYVIEEYLEGCTLSRLVAERGAPDRGTFFRFGLELCGILSYLHSLKPDPILFLDLRPDNLMTAGDGSLKLIDFDRAEAKSRAAEERKFYGTRFFAAPELFAGEIPDERADIYSFGAILYYMASGGRNGGTFPAGEFSGFPGRELEQLIAACLSPDRACRPGSMEEVKKKLEKLYLPEEDGRTVRAAVCSDRSGRGATRLALMLAEYYSGQGLAVLYREENDSGDLGRMAARRGLAPDRSGAYHFPGFRVRPYYGPGVSLENQAAEMEIYDLGTGARKAAEGNFDLVLLICGSCEWEREDIGRALEILSGEKNVRVVFNDLPEKHRPVLPDGGRLPPVFRLSRGAGSGNLPPDGFFRELFSGTAAEKKLKERRRGKTPGKKKKRWDFLRYFPAGAGGDAGSRNMKKPP